MTCNLWRFSLYVTQLIFLQIIKLTIYTFFLFSLLKSLREAHIARPLLSDLADWIISSTSDTFFPLKFHGWRTPLGNGWPKSWKVNFFSIAGDTGLGIWVHLENWNISFKTSVRPSSLSYHFFQFAQFSIELGWIQNKHKSILCQQK